MSEDRTQPPSKRRRQMAREQGQVTHSPELTAAAGWLAAVGVLWFCGGGLASVLMGLMRGALSDWDPGSMPADGAGLAGRVRGMALALAWPLGAIVGAFAAGATAAHQLQVRGLWAGRLIAPDPARLWTPGRGPGMAARSRRAGWSTLKAVMLLAALAWVIRAGWWEVLRLGSLEGPELAIGASRSLLGLASVLAVVLAVLGLADYGLCYCRFESMLRTTPEEQREDQRVLEGDVTARAQRRWIARSWRGDSPELLAGASLVLHGTGGLTVILSGGPPPRRILIRAVARTADGLRLRRSAEASKIPHIEDTELARRLAQHPAGGLPLPAERIAELAAIWPARPEG
jgi:flagellar biosynthetic protein FlhB